MKESPISRIEYSHPKHLIAPEVDEIKSMVKEDKADMTKSIFVAHPGIKGKAMYEKMCADFK